MNPTSTLKDAVYTYVGANALVLDKLNDVVTDRAEKVTDRLAPVAARFAPVAEAFGARMVDTPRIDEAAVRYQGWVADIAGVVEERLDLNANLGRARRTATRHARELHAAVEPMFVQIDGRLPEPVGKRLADGRTQAWAVFGAPAPKKAAPAKPAPATKAAATKVAAKKVAAKKASGTKTVA